MVSAGDLTQTPFGFGGENRGSENPLPKTRCLCEVTQLNKNKPGAEVGKNVQE